MSGHFCWRVGDMCPVFGCRTEPEPVKMRGGMRHHDVVGWDGNDNPYGPVGEVKEKPPLSEERCALCAHWRVTEPGFSGDKVRGKCTLWWYPCANDHRCDAFKKRERMRIRPMRETLLESLDQAEEIEPTMEALMKWLKGRNLLMRGRFVRDQKVTIERYGDERDGRIDEDTHIIDVNGCAAAFTDRGLA